jgi:hypothetical protein
MRFGTRGKVPFEFKKTQTLCFIKPALPPRRHFLPLTLSPRDCAAINEKPLALRDGIGGQVTKLWTCLREGASAKAGQNLLSVVY